MKGKRQRLTIMLIPHDSQGDGVRQFSLSKKSIRLFWFIFIGLIIFSILSLAHSISISVDHARLKRVKKENETLKKEVERFALKSERLESRFEKLEKVVGRLKTIAEIVKDLPRRLPKGRGGPILRGPKPASLDEAFSRIEESLIYQEKTLYEIKDVLEDKEDFLRAIPFVLPMSGRFTSGFGYRRCPFSGNWEFHEGIDIANHVGTPIYAPGEGVVLFVGWKSGYGRMIKIRHGFGYETIYGHTSRIMVKKGERVKRGDLIALSGDTGRSTGPHLHYEIRLHKRAINPWRCILF